MKRFLWVWLLVGGISCSSDDSPTQEEGVATPSETTNYIPCEGGMAGRYPCDGYDLLAQMPLNKFNAREGNDIWGWTDETTGKEYALMGVENGTVFIDITDTENVVYLGKLAAAGASSPWHDIKVYKNYAYIVSEAVGHGVQVFDLTKLRDVANPPENFSADNRYTGIGSAHNIVINEDTGFAYPVGTRRDDAFNGGVHFLDLSDPANPTAAGGWGANGYTHDAQVITYNGPDVVYLGKEIFVGANEDQVVLLDISDKNTPQVLSTIAYPNIGYTHQGWFTEDHRYFILGDELDEQRQGFRTRTLFFDMTDVNNPVLHHTYLGAGNAIDHNGYVLGTEFFLSNYTAGLRVLDITGVEDKSIAEKAFFDTYPLDDKTKFAGVWSVYPFFESGKIIISDINNGFFVIKKSN